MMPALRDTARDLLYVSFLFTVALLDRQGRSLLRLAEFRRPRCP
jgi:hypothetical protein